MKVLGSGFWVLGSGFWVLGSGFWVLAYPFSLTPDRQNNKSDPLKSRPHYFMQYLRC
jgi:hypothetical protein